jgi:hypothetical protein
MRSTLTVLSLCLLAGLAVVLLDQRSEAAEEGAWGSIKGVVVLNGDLPTPVELAVNKDQPHCLSKGKLFSDELVVNKDNKGVAHVFAWLAPLDPKGTIEINPKLKAVPTTPAVIDQPCCMFEPHALIVREGQELIIKNSSPVAHNANLLVDPRVNEGKNILLPAGGEQAIKGLKQQRLAVSLKCDIHPWMQAKVFVFNHPYAALTDANGNFEIKDAPVGKYKLMLWHDTGWVGGADFKAGREIEIKAGAATDLGKFEIVTGKK